MTFITASLLQGLYTEIFGVYNSFGLLFPFVDVDMPLLLVCSAVTVPVIRGQNLFYSIYIILKPLNTYITLQPLKDNMPTHSAFSLWRKYAIT